MNLRSFDKKIFLSLALMIGSILLGACEGEFAAKRAANNKILNGPFEMKFVKVGGTLYLAVLNTNYRFNAADGSLQFFDLSTPTSPQRVAALTLDLPSNASDFLIDGDYLYISDRIENQILFYRYDASAGKFIPRVDSLGVAIQVKVSQNPQSMVVFTHTDPATSQTSKRLAVSSAWGGTIHFLNIDSDSPTVIPTVQELPNLSGDLQVVGQKIGARLRMIPRRTTNSKGEIVDQRIAIGPGQRQGYGISKLLYLGGTNELLVTANYSANALFAFRYKTSENNSNIAWDLAQDRNGYGQVISAGSEVNIPGTGENGFRGMDIDRAGTVFLSSRSDNRLYKVPSAMLNLDTFTDGDTIRNTTGFEENFPAYRVNALFDFDILDKTFPRLGPLVTDCPPDVPSIIPSFTCTGTTEAKVVWILSEGTNRVFRVGLPSSDSSAATISASGEGVLGQQPQRLLWYQPSNLIYVANPYDSTISVLGADNLLPAGIEKIPTEN